MVSKNYIYFEIGNKSALRPHFSRITPLWSGLYLCIVDPTLTLIKVSTYPFQKYQFIRPRLLEKKSTHVTILLPAWKTISIIRHLRRSKYWPNSYDNGNYWSRHNQCPIRSSLIGICWGWYQSPGRRGTGPRYDSQKFVKDLYKTVINICTSDGKEMY